MSTVLITYLMASSFFYLIYKVILEGSRGFVFNRLYLLLSFVLPLFITQIQIPTPSFIPSEVLIIESIIVQPFLSQEQVTTIKEAPILKTRFDLWLILYVSVVCLLVIRFTKNALELFTTINNNVKIKLDGETLVLVDKTISPYSFLQYIFVNKSEFYQSTLPHAILTHERAHITQKHSYDIIFSELMQVFFWFNPFIYLTKNAIQLNHEFLADDAAIKSSRDVFSYQMLLLQLASFEHKGQFISKFNYFITKKRLIMMTKVQKLSNIVSRQAIIIPAVLVGVVFFGSKNIAQVTKGDTKVTSSITTPLEQSSSADLVDEYRKIVEKCIIHKDNANLELLTLDDKQRLKAIYIQLENEGLDKKLDKRVIPHTVLLPKNQVTAADLSLWLKNDTYHIIIDGVKVKKAEFAKYKSSEFLGHHVGWWNKPIHTKTKKYYGVWLHTHKYYNENSEVVFLPSPPKFER